MNFRRRLICATATVALALAAPSVALACGGFFCNANQPVNQAAERIIFADNGEGQVTAIVQILYAGPSEQFAWLLPVPSRPEVGVSSNVAFQRLQNATNPSYVLQTEFVGDCAVNQSARGGTASADAGTMEDGGVTVVASGEVGPYIYDVIEVDSDTQDAAQAAIDWLGTNQYDLTSTGPDLIRPYLEMNMMLIAFRLNKGADAGEIRPVTLTYDSDNPMIPIKLTAVAANSDMGVMVWVLGASRAVATNYRDLVLNEALINWFNPNSNYNDVVIAAADEAGGQGFVTEFAGSTDAFDETLIMPWEEDAMARVDTTDYSQNPMGLLQDTINTFGSWDGMAKVIDDAVPLPEGVTADQLIGCVDCVLDEGDLETFDAAVYLAAFHEDVYDPVSDTQELLSDFAHMTRLYTTLSAAEMTLDPEFDFNADLEDVSNQHTATRMVYCDENTDPNDAAWSIEFASVGEVWGQGTIWPVDLATSEQPRNQVVRQHSTSGAGEVITDNTRTISQALTASNAEYQAIAGSGGGSDGCACNAANGSGAGSTLLILAMVGLIARRKRVST